MTGLFRILFLLFGFVILRRMVRGLFLGNRNRSAEDTTPPRRQATATRDLEQEGLDQEIEEAEYEELD